MTYNVLPEWMHANILTYEIVESIDVEQYAHVDRLRKMIIELFHRYPPVEYNRTIIHCIQIETESADQLDQVRSELKNLKWNSCLKFLVDSTGTLRFAILIGRAPESDLLKETSFE
ncbi:MAG: hypothetical protein Sylvanvirus30_10 [Sylvanvirus sp.]|uniref:Uncharacterized protein n=1 Tax=Sylvanvirus sp. TaxID=2487774 RepID=A0A3G5AJ44_9VIRU|nr:MAG: hypothetical protein Sylvanvirus30_10 [Sylvanvirus sp.]